MNSVRFMVQHVIHESCFGASTENGGHRFEEKGVGHGWRSGTAHILDDDDPRERQRILSQANLARRLCMSTSKALSTNPLTIRVDLDANELAS